MKTLVLNLILVIACYNVNADVVRHDSIPPLCIENYEGYCYFSDFLFDDPEGCGIYQSSIVSGTLAIEGDKSRSISWDLKKGRYFGWGVDLAQGDPDGVFVASNVAAISFKIKLGTGNEKFRLQIKDANKVQPGINSDSFLEQSTQVQTVRILIQKFGSTVNLAALKDINFRFDKANSTKQGNIIIDDFKFEYNKN